jgi:hypothetical protein
VGLPALAIVAVVPNLSAHRWSRTPIVPAFFANRDYEECLAPGENVLVIPYGYLGDALVWQAMSDFHFRMAGGEFSPLLGKGFGGTTVVRLLHDDVRVADGGTVFALAREKGVSTILVHPTDPWPWETVLTPIAKPKGVGAVLLYPVTRGRSMSNSCTPYA